MVRVYSKYECECCSCTFFERQEAEDHEVRCFEDACNLRGAEEMVGRFYSSDSSYGGPHLYKVKDAHLQRPSSKDGHRKVMLDVLCVSVLSSSRIQAMGLGKGSHAPSKVEDWKEVSEKEYMDSLKGHIADVLDDSNRWKNDY